MSEDVGQSCRRARKLPVIGWVLTLALAIGGLSAGCRAADVPGPAQPGGVHEMLASVTMLSDAAMANEKGTGLQLPAVLDDPTGRQRVLLWDEIRATPQQLAPASPPNVSTGQ